MIEPRSSSDSALVEHWLTELAGEDRRVVVSPDLERRVMASWDARGTPVVVPTVSWWWLCGLGASACALAVAWLAWLRPGAVVPQERGADAARVETSAGLEWLDADPASLQIVHVRVPRGAFDAFGLPVVDPDADEAVDVELVLGADGAVRRVRLWPTFSRGAF